MTQRANKVREVLEKHGLDPKEVRRIRMSFKEDEQKRDEKLRNLAAPIRDHAAFIAEMMEASAIQPDTKFMVDGTRLEDVRIDGASASATLVQPENGKEHKLPIGFRKIDGEWFISYPW